MRLRVFLERDEFDKVNGKTIFVGEAVVSCCDVVGFVDMREEEEMILKAEEEAIDSSPEDVFCEDRMVSYREESESVKQKGGI